MLKFLKVVFLVIIIVAAIYFFNKYGGDKVIEYKWQPNKKFEINLVIAKDYKIENIKSAEGFEPLLNEFADTIESKYLLTVTSESFGTLINTENPADNINIEFDKNTINLIKGADKIPYLQLPGKIKEGGSWSFETAFDFFGKQKINTTAVLKKVENSIAEIKYEITNLLYQYQQGNYIYNISINGSGIGSFNLKNKIYDSIDFNCFIIITNQRDNVQYQLAKIKLDIKLEQKQL